MTKLREHELDIIEGHYADKISNCELARRYNVTEGAIRSIIKKFDNRRDLVEKEYIELSERVKVRRKELDGSEILKSAYEKLRMLWKETDDIKTKISLLREMVKIARTAGDLQKVYSVIAGDFVINNTIMESPSFINLVETKEKQIVRTILTIIKEIVTKEQLTLIREKIKKDLGDE